MSGVAVLHGGAPTGPYCIEVLDHLRIPYRVLRDFPDRAGGPAVLVVPVARELSPSGVQAAHRWVDDGGSLLLCGGPGDLAGLAGVEVVEHTGHHTSEGRVVVADDADWLPAPDVSLRAFGGVGLRPAEDALLAIKVLASWLDGAAAITACRKGRGRVLVIGADVFGSIVRIQQGWPVSVDGLPPADGTAPVDDGVLKVDDGLALSYAEDRALPAGSPPLGDDFVHALPPARAAPIFHRPQADLWRELFLHCLWWSAEQAGLSVPWLFYWPAGVPAVGHVSHDSDLNRDDDARAALRAFAAAEIAVTWCHCYPGGYSDDVIAAIGAAGHEHALHYNAMGDAELARWGLPYLRAQHAWAQAITGRDEIVTNKNHYTRWEGWAEFYLWCERLGIRIDQSRGGSKQGNSGFGFGSCHLAFPVAEDGRLIDVLMMPLHTQDLELFSHAATRDVVLDEVLARHGVAHFLFHGANINGRPRVHEAVVELAKAGRDRGMPWWTAEQLDTWERARRGVDLEVHPVADGWAVTVTAGGPLAGAAILLAGPGLEEGDGFAADDADVSVVRRHGRLFVELTADLAAGRREILVRRTGV